MGSLGFKCEVETQPSTSNWKKSKLPKPLLVGCDGGSLASVPRKLRSAIKKRAQESMTLPVSISKKRHVSYKANTLKKDGGKKPMPKRGHITKDEEEVAETLYALASMFSNTNKANLSGSGHEPASLKLLNDQETGGPTNAVEHTGIWIQGEESRKTSSKVNLDVTCHSRTFSRSKGSLKKPEVSSISGFESSLSVPPRPSVSNEQLIDLKQATVSGYQYGKEYNPINDKIQFEKSWKRSSTHVHISRLIKVLQLSENKEGSSKNLTSQLSTSDGAHRETGLNSGISPDVIFNQSFVQDQLLAPATCALHSAKDDGFYDFLSFGTGICSQDTSVDANRERHNHEGCKEFYTPHLPQLQIHPGMPFSLSQNGYSSTYHSQSFALTAQKAQPRQQWPDQFHRGRVRPANLDWENGNNTGPPSTANCAQALLTRFPAAISSSLPRHWHYQKLGKHQFPLGVLEQNRSTSICSDNVQKLQLP